MAAIFSVRRNKRILNVEAVKQRIYGESSAPIWNVDFHFSYNFKSNFHYFTVDAINYNSNNIILI